MPEEKVKSHDEIESQSLPCYIDNKGTTVHRGGCGQCPAADAGPRQPQPWYCREHGILFDHLADFESHMRKRVLVMDDETPLQKAVIAKLAAATEPDWALQVAGWQRAVTANLTLEAQLAEKEREIARLTIAIQQIGNVIGRPSTNYASVDYQLKEFDKVRVEISVIVSRLLGGE